jgi:hypothetical protein
MLEFDRRVYEKRTSLSVAVVTAIDVPDFVRLRLGASGNVAFLFRPHVENSPSISG